eukprot:6460148-Amphidinium_carterae.1
MQQRIGFNEAAKASTSMQQRLKKQQLLFHRALTGYNAADRARMVRTFFAELCLLRKAPDDIHKCSQRQYDQNSNNKNNDDKDKNDEMHESVTIDACNLVRLKFRGNWHNPKHGWSHHALTLARPAAKVRFAYGQALPSEELELPGVRRTASRHPTSAAEVTLLENSNPLVLDTSA